MVWNYLEEEKFPYLVVAFKLHSGLIGYTWKQIQIKILGESLYIAERYMAIHGIESFHYGNEIAWIGLSVDGICGSVSI